jgi:hypothetical protein
MNLYFKDINATGSWNDPDHWFEDAAATIAHNAVPWVADDATKGYDLYRSTDSVTSGEIVNIDATIGSGFVITGECFIGYNVGSTNGGPLQNTTNNNIYGGTYSGDSFDNNNGYIYAGKFSGDAFNNSGTIEGGLFIDIVRSSLGGTVNGGNFVPSGVTVLFFKNDNSDQEWTTASNWFSDYEGTTSAGLTDAPWTEDDATKDYWLARSLDSDLIGDDVNISYPATIGSSDNSWAITGGCAISYSLVGNGGLKNYDNIYGGTYSGEYFSNGGYIYGGTFSGYGFNSSNNIYGGTFSGDNFDNGGYIYGGTFSGDNFVNNSSIYGGTFSGDNLNNGGDIYGGTYSGEYFSNNGDINGGTYSGEYFTNTYYIYGGTFSGYAFYTTSIIYGGTFSGGDFIDDNNGANIYGGFWLESGSTNVAIFDYSSGGTTPTVSGYIRITGSISNPYPFELAILRGFMTLRIKGQDILGTSLL